MWRSNEGRTPGSGCSTESSARPRPGSNAKGLPVRTSRMAEEELETGSGLSDASSVRNCRAGLRRHSTCTTLDIADDVSTATVREPPPVIALDLPAQIEPTPKSLGIALPRRQRKRGCLLLFP